MSRLRRRGYLAAFLALCLFAGLAAGPWVRGVAVGPAWVRASVGSLTAAPQAQAPEVLPPVTLVATARPQLPDGPRASAPSHDAGHQIALVALEDRRLRTLLHRSARLVTPTVISLPGSVPTLVLPPRPAPYTAADLIRSGALVAQPGGSTALLVDSVLAVRGTTLLLVGSSTSTLLMNGDPDRFTSIVSWGGRLMITGTAAAPLRIMGWNRTAGRPAADLGQGRSYLRAVGADMVLRFARVSALGFWSGRTGGVAWTGSRAQPSVGGADNSVFSGNTYGVFLSHTDHLRFTDDLFQFNDLDGLHLHRYAAHTTVSGSAAARNGGAGFVVDRGATATVLSGDLSVNNGGDGYLLDGRPLAAQTAATGSGNASSVGTTLTASDSELDGRTGILVEGGQATVLSRNRICAPITAIALRDLATATVLAGNDIECGGRVAVSIGPGVVGTTMTANRFSDARIGVLIRGASGVRLVNNAFSRISVFGLSLRGATPGVVGAGNSIAGHGLRPVDVRAGAIPATLTGTDLTGWTRNSHPTPMDYLRYHPILLIWLVILALVAVAYCLTRLRRRAPARLYAHTVAPVLSATALPQPVAVLQRALPHPEAHRTVSISTRSRLGAHAEPERAGLHRS